jgi:Nif-specific regulatory protein
MTHRQYRPRFETLLAICEVIDQALDLESALGEVLRILSETLQMQRATITLMDKATGLLSIAASHGLTAEEKQRGIYRLGEGVTGRIFKTAKPYYVPDISREPLFLDRTGARRLERGRISFVGVPVILNGKPIGVLNVDRLFGDDVSVEQDMDFLSVVATLVAQFISLNEKIRSREEALRRENVSLKYTISKKSKGLYIVGDSQSMQEVERQIARVAPTRATVLLLGESGVGKTLIARIIHQLSERSQHPFVKVNCAAIPDNLLESELFGHEKGAFTGATAPRAGRFEDAHKGTIFLDEIGELPLAVQSKLLRVLQEREFERLGSNTTRTTDVRILAATNRDLAALAKDGGFRSDLFYRLSVFPIMVPPLRERREDLPGLLHHFLEKVAREYGRRLTLTPRAFEMLKNHDWPGNVREMENLMERMAILADSERIDTPLLNGVLTKAPVAEKTVNTDGRPQQSLEETERREILAALRDNAWVQYKAAVNLGLTPRQMGYRIRKFGLDELVAMERARSRKLSDS